MVSVIYSPLICSEKLTYFYSALLTFLNKSSILFILSFLESNLVIVLVRFISAVKYIFVILQSLR